LTLPLIKNCPRLIWCSVLLRLEADFTYKGPSGFGRADTRTLTGPLVFLGGVRRLSYLQQVKKVHHIRQVLHRPFFSWLFRSSGASGIYKTLFPWGGAGIMSGSTAGLLLPVFYRRNYGKTLRQGQRGLQDVVHWPQFPLQARHSVCQAVQLPYLQNRGS